MGVKKGQDNFSPWRKDRVKKHLAMIKQAVIEAKKHSLKFDNENKMASWVSTRVGVHRTTITRSIIYMQPIRDYFYGQAGIGSIEINEETSSDVLQTKIKALLMEVTRKDQDLKRLTRYIEKHNIPTTDDDNLEAINNINSSNNIECSKKISNLCSIIKLIHERVKDHIQIDRAEKVIKDLTVRGARRIVASGKKVDVLFDWLEENDI